MNSRFVRRPLRGVVPVVLALAAACTDSPTGPGVKPEPEVLASIQCHVNVPANTMACSYPEDVLAGSAIRTTRLFGGQDKYVKLANYGNTVQDDTLSMYVTVQNLLADPLGDGTPPGIMIFFYDEPSNGVTVANPSGTDIFLGGPAPYFLYNQVLTTYEVSNPVLWQFALNGASTFSFTVLVSSSQSDESQSLLDLVWNGSVSSDWATAGNWTPSGTPSLATAVAIQAGGVLPNQPVLGANGQAGALLVASGRTLGLGGYNLEVDGNVAAPGTISGGTLTMSGTGTLLNGNVPSLFVTGSTALQASTVASGAVSVTGSLTVADSALSISIP